MSSFDSNLTARAADSDGGEDDAVHQSGSTRLLSGIQPGIFEVLQKLTGVRDRAPASAVDVSVVSVEVTPEDDPRFVLWGTCLSSSPENSASSDSQLPHAGERMIIAASIERWVAQLTSVLDFDELLNFYLTFRTFITPVDLCRLLICRFQWSLVHADSSVDASVRKIVRIRTFVAIKYWLQTFFAVDFLPNRDLRLFFAGWLNTAGEDPNVTGSPDALVGRIKYVFNC
jgi:Gdp/GTP exchange factor required for growth at low temperatures